VVSQIIEKRRVQLIRVFAFVDYDKAFNQAHRNI